MPVARTFVVDARSRTTHAPSCSLEEVEDHIDEALREIAKVTGEDEPDLSAFLPPLPAKAMTEEEVFAARRVRAAEIKAGRSRP